MPSDYERFWSNSSYAFVGHSAKANFPRISYGELKKQGRRVFAVDPSVDEIDGDVAYPDLASLPERVDAVVLELPKDETREWVARAADAGIREVWIHMGRETPEAVALAQEKGLHVLTGTCAVMYLRQGFSYHSLHRWIAKMIGKY